METFPLPSVIEVSGSSPPAFTRWQDNKYIIISEQDISVNSYFYSWASIRASVTVYRGCWYYEVKVRGKANCRIGWCTNKHSDDVLGIDDNSWSWDGAAQKKYHKSTEGNKYGEVWCRGDTIGCQLDFGQRRITYYKNGKSLGVAFSSLRLNNVGMIPAISVTCDTKVSVNLGPDLLYLPMACCSLNPTTTSSQKKSLEQVFSVYESKNEHEEELICGQGLIQLAGDLGSTGPLDPTLLIIAWCLFSSRQWEFTKLEWLSGWTLQCCYTFEQISHKIKQCREWLVNDEDIFKNFYQFVFDYLKQPKTTNIEKQEALFAWKIVGIDKRWTLFTRWEKFLEDNPTKVIPKDGWNMLLRFIQTIDTKMENYNENDSWPTLLDEFVKTVKKELQ